jgi:hypothetical protein
VTDIQPIIPSNDDLFEQAMAKIHAMDPANNEVVEPDVEEEVTEPVEESPPSEVNEETLPLVEDEYITLGDNKITKTDAQRYYEFEQFLKQNPEVAERINEALRVQPIEQAKVEPVTPEPLPDFIDETDPSTAYLLAELNKLRDQQTTFVKDFQDRKQREDQASYESARDQWAAKYNFSPEEVRSIEQEGANLRIMPGLILNGMSIQAATDKTLDTALRSIPEIYDRYNASRNQAERVRDNADKLKQSKLSALAGKTGISSVPVAPATPAEKRSAMVDEIASALNE